MVPWCLFCSLNYFQSGQTETFLLIFGALALSMVTRLATYRSANFEQAFTSTDGARVIVVFVDLFSILSWAFSLTNGARVFILFIELFPIRTD